VSFVTRYPLPDLRTVSPASPHPCLKFITPSLFFSEHWRTFCVPVSVRFLYLFSRKLSLLMGHLLVSFLGTLSRSFTLDHGYFAIVFSHSMFAYPVITLISSAPLGTVISTSSFSSSTHTMVSYCWGCLISRAIQSPQTDPNSLFNAPSSTSFFLRFCFLLPCFYSLSFAVPCSN